MTDVPHFDYPFRFSVQGHAVVVEQDSIEDIESCLQTILLTERGQRIEVPVFGTDSLLFGLQPLPIDDLLRDLADQEPRAVLLLSQRPDPLDYLTALVEVDVTSQHPRIGDS